MLYIIAINDKFLCFPESKYSSMVWVLYNQKSFFNYIEEKGP